jgi:site-specific DNA-methyltransferase (adenine-specific)
MPVNHLGTELVPIDQLQPHAENPNAGDVDAIAESLKTSSQYRSIVAAKIDGSDQLTILAGHHVWKAAQQLGWTDIRVDVLEADAQSARRIMVADNRLPELGEGLDNEALLAVLNELGDEGLAGTGYDASDLDDLVAAIEEAADADTTDTFGRTDGTGITGRRASYEDSDARMIVLQYNGDTYVELVEALAELSERLGTSSNAETVHRLISEALGATA